MEALTKDLRFALRMLAKNPGFTAVAALTLALGIGANSAIFSVVYGVLLKPLPYPNPDRLVRVYERFPGVQRFPLSPADFLDYREQNQVLDGLAVFRRSDLQISDQDRPIQLNGMQVSYGFFRILGFQPALGRDFNSDEENNGATLPPGAPLRDSTQIGENVAIISDKLWRSHFGADPVIIGKRLDLSARPFTIIGVMPPGLQHVGGDYHSLPHGDSVDVWWPLNLSSIRGMRSSHFINGIARLKPGITRQQAEAQMNLIAEDLQGRYPDSNKDSTITLASLRDEIVGNARPMLLALLAVVAAVLLIACANVASLLMGRALSREREIAIRAALGAGNWRMVRQMLTESAVLGLLGGAAGLVVAAWAVKGFAALYSEKLPRVDQIGIDGRILAATFAISMLTGVLAGLLPALQVSAANLNEILKEASARATGGRRNRRLRSCLVAAEISLSFALLVVAALLMRSLLYLQHIEPGFRAENVLTLSIDLPDARYRGSEKVATFYVDLLDRIRDIPGVQRAGATSDLPWTGYGESTNFGVEGRSYAQGGVPEARYHFVSEDYFHTLGTALVEGRDFSAADNKDSTPVLLINQKLAKTIWPDEDPLGKRIRTWGKSFTVVGIVGDVKDSPQSPEAQAAFYWPVRQMPQSRLFLAVRCYGDPSAVSGAVRNGVEAQDRNLPITDLRTMPAIAESALSSQRFTLLLVGVFAGVALALAALGAYGVISYSVNQRRHEIGIRMSLGAIRYQVLWLVFRESMGIATVGIVVGIAVAAGATQAVSGLLYGITPLDGTTFLAVAILSGLTAAAASLGPALRAAKVDPIEWLRYE